MNKKYIALGAFLVVTLGLMIWLAQNVGALGRGAGDHYTVRLRHAAGLVEDNAVKIAGVKVGEISEIEIDHDEAILHLRVRPGTKLHVDTVAIVRAKSLLGEKYLQLDPGTREADLLKPGSEIEKVRNTFEIDEVLNALQPILGGGEDGDSLAGAIAPLAKRVDRLLAGAMGEDGAPAIITREELDKTLDDAQAIVASVRRILETNEPKIAELLDNGNRLLSDPRIPRIIGNLDRLAATTANRLPGTLDEIDHVLGDVRNVTSKLTPERAERLAKAIDDLSAAASSLRKISDDIAKISDDVSGLISKLNKLLVRVLGIDELTIRKFVQQEGIKVNLKVPKDVKKQIDSLED